MLNMLSRLVLFFGVCIVAHCHGLHSENASNSGTVHDNERNGTFHIHVHNNKTINSSDQYIARDESAYFVSALFQRYNSSNQLSLDGFVRMLCRLGLLPELTDDKDAEADDATGGKGRKICSTLTFDQVPPRFENLETRFSDYGHDDHEHSEDGRYPKNVHDTNTSSHKNEDETMHHEGSVHNSKLNASEQDVQSRRTSVANSTDKQNSSAMVGKHSSELVKRWAFARNPSDSDRQGSQSKVHVHPTHMKKCASPKELLSFFHILTQTLDIEQFTLLCPALLYKLDTGYCGHHDHHDDEDDHHDHDHHDHDHHDHDHHDPHDHQEEEKVEPVSLPVVSAKVWGYSTAAVLVISLAGLLGVAVIPIMQKVFYNHLLQFLVAIAVGALSGDALLHLLPHAIAKNQAHKHDSHDPHDHAEQESREHDHLESVWKGLIALTCIFFFFLIERVLTIVTEKKRRKKAMVLTMT